MLERATNVPFGRTGSGFGALATTETGEGEATGTVGLEAGGVAEARVQATPARVPTTMRASERRNVIRGLSAHIAAKVTPSNVGGARGRRDKLLVAPLWWNW